MKAKIIKLDLKNRDIQIQFIGSDRIMQFESYVLEHPDLMIQENDIVRISRKFTQPNQITIEKIYSEDENDPVQQSSLIKAICTVLAAALIFVISVSYIFHDFNILSDSSFQNKTLENITIFIALSSLFVFICACLSIIFILITKLLNALKK